jgi:glycosyltransferase involved in cell wall biosynthesis
MVVNNMTHRHKILFIESGSGRGGSTKYLYYFLKYINRKLFEPLVAFYFFNDGPDTKLIKTLGVPVFFLNNERERPECIPVKCFTGTSQPIIVHRLKVMARFLLRTMIVNIPAALRLTALIRKESVSLVVLNNDVHCHLTGTLGARISGIPCICRKAGGIGDGRRLKKLLTRHIDLFVAISRATAEDQIKNNPSTRRLVTIPEGVDLNMYNPDTADRRKEDFGIPPHKKIVGNISRFDTGKGQLELLEAAAMIKAKYPDVIFLMVGDGELMDELQSRAKALNITDCVVFTGWRTDVACILSKLDIFVHCPTTWIEGLGIANIEAAAMGKPAVVSDNGGLPDVVLDGVTGFVVPPGDIERMAETILRLLNDGEMAAQFGINARRRVQDSFDIEKNIREFERLLLEYV